MLNFFIRRLPPTLLMKGFRRSQPPVSSCQQPTHRDRSTQAVSWLLLSAPIWVLVGALASLAQTDKTIQKQEDRVIRQYAPPTAPTAPVYRPPAAPRAPIYRPPAAPAPAAEPTRRRTTPTQSAPASNTPDKPGKAEPVEQIAPSNAAPAIAGPTSQYVMEFNRSPIVGNALRLKGVYAEARLGFTRPKDWNLKSVKALVRFQHSPALLANRSNLTVQVNGRNVGSTPLNRKAGQIGQLLVNIPPNVIQNYNELTVIAQQNNKADCSDPGDATLWTEVLPDSKLLFGFQPKAVPLDFSNYPYPFFDELSLDPGRIAYLVPAQPSEAWLTSAARFQAGLGRVAGFRPVETRLFKKLTEVPPSQRLILIGTPTEQPALKSLKLPYAIANNQFVDGSNTPIAEDVGLLMLATTRDGGVPVLVITGNGVEGVAKATQALVQPGQRKLQTGSAVLVDQLADVPDLSPRQWANYLPEQNSFKLSDLKGADNKPFKETTVRGAYSAPVEFNFQALPDDRFKRGSSMTVYYSHSPQVNPRLSTLEVRLDGVPIGAKRLTSEDGATHESLNVNLPENLVKPNSKIQVAFNLTPKELGKCGQATDQQLWGKVHSDTQFNLNRENSVQLPNLELLKAGYPFAAPQDLSRLAIALPDAPNTAEIQTLMEFSERLGRLSESEAVKLQVYTTSTLPEEQRKAANLVGIGRRDRFPFPEVYEAKGFNLGNLFTRQSQGSQIQALPDTGGVIKQIISPWNGERVLLALTAQSDAGLDKVRDLFHKDSLFFQLKEDTVVLNTTEANPSEYDPDAYALQFFQEANRTSRIDNTSPLSKVSNFFRENWVLLPTGIALAALLSYGIAQLYLKRVAAGGDKK